MAGHKLVGLAMLLDAAVETLSLLCVGWAGMGVRDSYDRHVAILTLVCIVTVGLILALV